MDRSGQRVSEITSDYFDAPVNWRLKIADFLAAGY
jgi:hypothetical protein